MSRAVSFGFSPCPNDTFAFHALVHGLVEAPAPVEARLHDVEELNQRALQGRYELTKLSFAALGHLLDRYALLGAGAALGRGCGPLLVARPGSKPDLDKGPIALPGRMTTAYLLACLYLGKQPNALFMEFSQVMEAVAEGRAQAGVIIHEGRFTYQRQGLEMLVDLGQWWEEQTGLPIPLGCIAVRRDLGPEAASQWERALSASVAYAFDRPQASRDYVLAHAQEMENQVVAQHIDLYVNQFSLDLGPEGMRAAREVLERGRQAGLFPGSDFNLGW